MLVVDDLVGWLVGRLADAGYQKVSTRLRGSEQDRVLSQAVAVAVQAVVGEISPSDEQRADQLAARISGAFGKRVPVRLPPGRLSRLEALRAGIAGQLSVLDDAGAAADLFGVSADVVADRLTAHLIYEISARGSAGGPLEPLANQLDHDLTHSRLDELKNMVDRLLSQAAGAPDQLGSALGPGGRPLAEVSDPFALEVHRPVQPEGVHHGLPALPAYVAREHDVELRRVVAAAAGGSSGIAALVGRSSTGKTRACWEALRLLRGQEPEWRLWHPIDPSRPDAALGELPGVGQRTVVWLNEAQLYLNVADGELGERVAAGLRALLRDPARAPVLVLATLWPQFWDTLTARPAGGADPHAQARELLAGRDITVPDAFTPAQLEQAAQAGDARLALAAAGVQDGQVIQFLAGAPELLARYRNAPPAARALIHAAMDARRLGMRTGLPQAFLAAAAPGYLTDTGWDALGEDWLEQALAYTAVPCKGVRGPLTRIRPRPASSRATSPGSADSDEQSAGDLASSAGGPAYRLADYLDQHGRHHRNRQIPPADFWAAAAAHALPSDQAALGDAAVVRGLYRDSAQLYKNAAARGNLRAVSYLRTVPHYLRGDVQFLRWAAAHIALDEPRDVAFLLDKLRAAGAEEEVTALADRAAAHVALDDLGWVAFLLDKLREAGAQEQVTVLAGRIAADAPLNKPGSVDLLLDSLRKAGAQEQVTVLAGRAAAHAALDDPDGVANLLGDLREAGAQEQVTVLAGRAAAQAPVDDPYPYGVAKLLGELRKAGAQEQVAVLAGRIAAHAPLDDPLDVAKLLDSLREAGAQDQVGVLLRRDPAAHVALEDTDVVGGMGGVGPLLDSLGKAGAQDQAADLAGRIATHADLAKLDTVIWLIRQLRKVGVQDQAAALVGRAAAHVALDDPGGVAKLLDSLLDQLDYRWDAGMEEQATVLATRAAAHVALDDPRGVAKLLDSLHRAEAAHYQWGAGIEEQATVLATRAAAHVALDDPDGVAKLLDSLREAGAQDQGGVLLRRDPAAHVALDDPDGVAKLLDSLREAGAQDQVGVLLRRDPAAHVALDDPDGVAWLIRQLRKVGAQDQAAALAGRAAAHAPLNKPRSVTRLITGLQKVGAQDQAAALAGRAAAQVSLDDPHGVADLLGSLREVGAQDQAAALAGRAAAQVSLDDPHGVADLLGSLRAAGMEEQVAELVNRLPGAGWFSLFREQQGNHGLFQFGREADGSPAEPWGWEDLD